MKGLFLFHISCEDGGRDEHIYDIEVRPEACARKFLRVLVYEAAQCWFPIRRDASIAQLFGDER
jgi:hypothetical protein